MYIIKSLISYKVKKLSFPVFLIVAFFLNSRSLAQDRSGPDELYTQARQAAFDNDDYATAISLTKKAIAQSPDYLEVQVFLGRLYTFTDSISKARIVLREVLQKEPGREDASLAYGNLEYWNENPDRALEIVNQGLTAHDGSEDLLLLKAKILKDLERYDDANQTLNRLLKINPRVTKARTLMERIKVVSVKNAIGTNYEFVYFDERFDDPWHLASIDYLRQTRLGSVIGRINYANRFTNNGLQFEVDAYPRISDLFYAYANFGISNENAVFPRYRAGFSLYANLPAAFEADAGFRYLAFNNDTWIYTAGIGKYYKNFWFNLRAFYTPSRTEIAQAYALTTRYYLGGADDYISFRIGTGISPDDPTNNILLNRNDLTTNPDASQRLQSNNIELGYRMLFKSTHIFSALASLENQQYGLDKRGNQYSVSLIYIKRF